MNHSGPTDAQIHAAIEIPAKAVVTPARRSWFRWAVVGAIFAFCAFFLDLNQVMNVLRRVSVPWLLFILVVSTFDRLLMAYKWSVLLRALQVEMPLAQVIRFCYQGMFVGTFLPSSIGGDVLRAYWVSRSTGATPQVYASLLMEKIIGVLSAVNWALIGMVVFALGSLHKATLEWMRPVLLGTLLLNALFILSLQSQCYAFIQRGLTKLPRSRLLGLLERLMDAYMCYGKRRWALVWNGILTVIEHGLQLFIVLLMARSLSIEANTILFIAIAAVQTLLYRIPIAPDGWGVGEVTAIGLFGLIGVPPESAFALALFSHVIQMLVVLPGGWYLWRSQGTIGRLQWS